MTVCEWQVRQPIALIKINPKQRLQSGIEYIRGFAKFDTPKIKFKELVRIMVDADLELLRLESPGEGKKILEKHFSTWHHWDSQVISMDEH